MKTPLTVAGALRSRASGRFAPGRLVLRCHPAVGEELDGPLALAFNSARTDGGGPRCPVLSGLEADPVDAGSLEVNSRFTVILQTGFTFAPQQALTDTGASTFTMLLGGTGLQSAIFTEGQAALVGEAVRIRGSASRGGVAPRFLPDRNHCTRKSRGIYPHSLVMH